MKARCECGRPAAAFAAVRSKSSRAVRAGKPLKIKGHDKCPGCWRKFLDATRAKA